MARPAPIARLAAASVFLAVGLWAGGAGAQTAPPPAPEPPVTLPPPADPVTLDVGVRIGGAARLGDAPAFAITGRGGVVLGVGAAVAPSPRWAVGVAYEHADLGTEQSNSGDTALVNLSRSLDSVWATVRLNLFHTDWFAVGVTIGPGLVWQHVDANVILYATEGIPDAFRCADTAGVGLGLRAGIGAEARLGEGFVLSLDGVVDELRLSSDPIGTCAPGAGSTAQLGARVGLGWRFDVSRYLR